LKKLAKKLTKVINFTFRSRSSIELFRGSRVETPVKYGPNWASCYFCQSKSQLHFVLWKRTMVLVQKYYLILKHSSFKVTFINYGRKCFMTLCLGEKENKNFGQKCDVATLPQVCVKFGSTRTRTRTNFWSAVIKNWSALLGPYSKRFSFFVTWQWVQ